jgi:hypothetical protein
MTKERVIQVSRWLPEHSDYTFLGSGVVIAPSLVITAKHVLARNPEVWPPEQLFPPSEVFIHSDQGAFGGGWPAVWEVTPHPNPQIDLVLLRVGEVEDQPAAFADQPLTSLPHDADLLLHGYSDCSVKCASLSVRLVTRGPAFGLDYLDRPAEEGYSGGAVSLDDRLIGIICRSTRGQALVQSFDRRVLDFIEQHVCLDRLHRAQPISAPHLTELRRILAQLPAPPPAEVVQMLFSRILRSAATLAPKGNQGLFDAALEDLQKRHHGPDEAPLLLFLQACREHEDFDAFLSDQALADLTAWQQDAINRVGMHPELLRARVAAALNPPAGSPPPTLVLKLEPRLDLVAESYLLNGWWGYGDTGAAAAEASPPMEFDRLPDQDDTSTSEYAEDAVERDGLGDAVAARIARAFDAIRPDRAHDLPRLEIVLPLALLDWRPRQVRTRPSVCLTEDYPVILRSWERHCRWPMLDRRENPETPGGWSKRSDALRDGRLTQAHVLPACEARKLTDDLRRHLNRRRQHWAMIAHCPQADEREAIRQQLHDGLCEGLPLLLWPLVGKLDTASFHDDLLAWLCGTPHAGLPELLHEARCNPHPDWQDLAVLWDDARRRIPGTGFPAHSTR